MRRLLVLLALLVAQSALVARPALALDPGEALKNPVLEHRAREISKNLRCLVCQNESIDDSNAALAKDLRRIVRERLVKGDTDEQVIAYITARYGNFVLLRPPIMPTTWLLWFGPPAILLLAAIALALRWRRRRVAGASAAPPPLSEAERRQLHALEADRGEGAA
jgi:cytochrome c-type biogenesis protein CcmH